MFYNYVFEICLINFIMINEYVSISTMKGQEIC